MVNVFSFCLYGAPDSKYYPGMIENIQLINQHFSDWHIYIYTGIDVPSEWLSKFRSYPNVVVLETGASGAQNMIHRFYAIDVGGVDLMMVRDADSRVHWKDRWAIREFVRQPQFIAHTIRDNKHHTAYIMGGLWGLRKSAGICIQTEYANYKEDLSRGHRVAHDQNFLADVIHPKVVDRLLLHQSITMHFPNEQPVLFPFVWSNDCYCGKIEERSFVDTPAPSKTPFPFLNTIS